MAGLQQRPRQKIANGQGDFVSIEGLSVDGAAHSSEIDLTIPSDLLVICSSIEANPR